MFYNAHMKFSTEQQKAIKAVAKWLNKGDTQVFRLFGYAGTGKTTLAQHLTNHTDGEIFFAAFTGKAALMMRKRGAPNASTIHSLIYHPRGETLIKNKKGQNKIIPTFEINPHSPITEAALIVIDECSMVDQQLGEDLLSFKKPVLVLGDPGQLPPINTTGFFTNQTPDILLENIHRQAKDNPIIELAHKVRHGEQIKYGTYGASKIIKTSQIKTQEVLAADQILVGKNHTRRIYNQRIRQLKNLDHPLPCHNDKIVALRNDFKKGLLNGSLWRVKSAIHNTKPFMNLDIASEDEEFTKNNITVKILKSTFESPDTPIPYTTRKRYDEFDYGYALTVHKSQGSQWEDVYIFNESNAFPEYASRWLYTAITRASKKITLVQ